MATECLHLHLVFNLFGSDFLPSALHIAVIGDEIKAAMGRPFHAKQVVRPVKSVVLDVVKHPRTRLVATQKTLFNDCTVVDQQMRFG